MCMLKAPIPPTQGFKVASRSKIFTIGRPTQALASERTSSAFIEHALANERRSTFAVIKMSSVAEKDRCD